MQLGGKPENPTATSMPFTPEPPSCDAFEQYVRSARTDLHRRAYQLCRDPYEAEDLLQETFAALYRRWQYISGVKSPTAYAHKVLVNIFYAARRRARWNRELLKDLHSDEYDHDAYIDEGADTRVVISHVLKQLSEPQRWVVILRYMNDLPANEVGILLNMPTSTVTSHSRRALIRLRESLAPHVGLV